MGAKNLTLHEPMKHGKRRPIISITLDSQTYEDINAMAEYLGVSRSSLCNIAISRLCQEIRENRGSPKQMRIEDLVDLRETRS